MNTFNLQLDLDKSARGYPNPVVRLRKGDKAGTTIVAAIYDHGTKLTTSGLAASMEMLLPDGTHYYRAQGTYNAGVVTVQLDESHAASVTGDTSIAYIRLYQGETVIASTEPFAVRILRSAVDEGEDPAESYDDIIPVIVRQWLAEHPEATTTVQDNSLTTAKYQDSSVTTAKIANNAITSGKIADGAVGTSDLANSSVTSAKIADGTIVAGDLASNAVTTAKINDSAVTEGKLANNAVTSGKIADGAVGTSDIAGNAVTNAKLADNAVTTPKIANEAVTDAKLSPTGILAKVASLAGNVLRGTGSGAVVTARDAYAAPPLGLTVDGKSVQDGTPTPSSPVAIDSVESVAVHASADGTTDATGWPVSIDLDGHVLRSLPDGTHDELLVGADGNVTLVQRVGSASLPTTGWTNSSANGGMFYHNMTGLAGARLSNDYTLLSAKLKGVAPETQGTMGQWEMSIHLVASTGMYNLYVKPDATISAYTPAQFMEWLSSNPISADYILATPVTYDLGIINLPDTPAPDLTAWAVTDPSTTIELTYERDLTIAINAIEEAIADLATS